VCSSDLSAGDTTPAISKGTDFGDVETTDTASRVFTVRNDGNSVLNLNSVTITPLTGFQLLSEPASTLLPGVSSTFSVRFSPHDLGVRNATVSIESDDLDQASFDFAVSGTGRKSVYVDDSWSGLSSGEDPDGDGPATVFGVDAFSTIQAGITAVDPGETVHVNPGQYSEAVLINRSLTLSGTAATRDVVISPPSGLDDGISIIKAEIDVTVENLTVSAARVGISAQTLGSLVVRNTDSSGNSSAGFHAENAASVSVIGGNFSSNGGDGIRIHSTADVVVTAATVNLNEGDGVEVQDVNGTVTLVSTNGDANRGVGLSAFLAGTVSIQGGTWSGIRTRSTSSVEFQNPAVASTEAIDIEADDQVRVLTDVDARTSTIRILANHAGLAQTGFLQAAGTTISTGNESSAAIDVTVNSLRSGAGHAEIAQLVTGSSTGQVRISTHGGSLRDNNGAAENISAAGVLLSGMLGVGTDQNPINVDIRNIEGAGGTAGFHVSATGDVVVGGAGDMTVGIVATNGGGVGIETQLGSVTIIENVTASGTLVVKVEESLAGGEDIMVGATILSGSGEVILIAADDLAVSDGSMISAVDGVAFATDVSTPDSHTQVYVLKNGRISTGIVKHDVSLIFQDRLVTGGSVEQMVDSGITLAELSREPGEPDIL
ncbi:MAG: choice-of-anchor D domain-containing protein, partial [Planctomycetaceae bacterium]